MSEKSAKQQDTSSPEPEKQAQTAIPYIPPPPPDESIQKKFRSPLVNGIIAALIILLGGFMLYNFVGHEFTRIEGVSNIKTIPISPTSAPRVSPSISPSVSTSPAPSP